MKEKKTGRTEKGRRNNRTQRKRKKYKKGHGMQQNVIELKIDKNEWRKEQIRSKKEKSQNWQKIEK